jgi:hypothetical protein
MNRLFDVNVSQSMRLSLIARVHLEPAAAGISPSPECHPDCRNESRWSVAEDGPERLRASIGFYPGQVGDVSVAHGTSSLLVYALSSTHCDAFASPPSRAPFSFLSPLSLQRPGWNHWTMLLLVVLCCEEGSARGRLVWSGVPKHHARRRRRRPTELFSALRTRAF